MNSFDSDLQKSLKLLQFLKTLLLHDPQGKYLSLQPINLAPICLDLLGCIQKLTELAVGDQDRVIRALTH